MNGSKGTNDISQSNELPILEDEGYQSALDCTTCKQMEDKLLKLEESYKHQISDLEFEIKFQQQLIDKKDHDNKIEDENLQGNSIKGKGGKFYVKKTYHLEEEQLKEELSKIKTEKNMELEKLKIIIEEMKRMESEYIETINELTDEHQRIIEEKDQEINYLRKIQAAVIGRGYLSEPSKMKNERKHLKIEEMDEESQLMIANIEALRESDKIIYDKMLSMLEWQKY